MLLILLYWFSAFHSTVSPATLSNHGDHDQCPSFLSSLVHTLWIAHPSTFHITGNHNIHALHHICFHQSLLYPHSKLSFNLINHTAAILFCYVELYAKCSNESLLPECLAHTEHSQ